MKRNEICFAVIVKQKEVVTIGRSFIAHPAIRYAGNKIKWFDDGRIAKSKK